MNPLPPVTRARGPPGEGLARPARASFPVTEFRNRLTSPDVLRCRSLNQDPIPGKNGIMGRLIVQPYGGLCNRLRAVISASILADSLGRDFQVDWVPDPLTCGCMPGDLFQRFPGSDIGADRGGLRKVRDETGLRRIEAIPAHTDIRIRSQGELRPRDLDGSQFEAEFRRRLRALQPHPALLSRVPKAPRGTIGLQIRRSDHWIATRYSPLRLFHEAIGKISGDAARPHIYLATDSPQVAESFAQRYGPRLWQLEGRRAERGTVEGVADALVDLLALSRTSLILGSAHSSFGSMASRWGGTPLRTLSLAGAPETYAGGALDRLHLRFLRFDRTIGRFRPRRPTRWAGRILSWMLSPLVWGILVPRSDRVLGDAYQEGTESGTGGGSMSR